MSTSSSPRSRRTPTRRPSRMGATCTETLAAGLWRDGHCHRDAVLRELDSETCRAVLDAAAAALPAERTTAVLSAALIAIGDVTGLGSEEVRELSIGDRDRLLLALRRLQRGDSLECVLRCACGEQLEVDLELGSLLAAMQ